jgi:hypothetical protein
MKATTELVRYPFFLAVYHCILRHVRNLTRELYLEPRRQRFQVGISSRTIQPDWAQDLLKNFKSCSKAFSAIFYSEFRRITVGTSVANHFSLAKTQLHSLDISFPSPYRQNHIFRFLIGWKPPHHRAPVHGHKSIQTL